MSDVSCVAKSCHDNQSFRKLLNHFPGHDASVAPHSELHNNESICIQSNEIYKNFNCLSDWSSTVAPIAKGWSSNYTARELEANLQQTRPL